MFPSLWWNLEGVIELQRRVTLGTKTSKKVTCPSVPLSFFFACDTEVPWVDGAIRHKERVLIPTL